MSSKEFCINFFNNDNIVVTNNQNLRRFLITKRIKNIIYRYEDSLYQNIPIEKIVNKDLSTLFNIPEDKYIISYKFEITNFGKEIVQIKFKTINKSFIDKVKDLFIQ